MAAEPAPAWESFGLAGPVQEPAFHLSHASDPKLLASGGFWFQAAGSVKGGVSRDNTPEQVVRDLNIEVLKVLRRKINSCFSQT